MKKIIFILIYFICTSVYAQNKQQQELINSDKRPNIQLMLSNPSVYLEQYATVQNQFALQQLPTLKQHLADFIISLERVYPGARYAFLGRDMDMVADAVDAFYISIGQPDKVIRIPFSTPSLASADGPTIAKFLVQLGLQGNVPKSNLRSFIIIDYTSFSIRNPFSSSSQSRKVFQGAVDYLREQGIPGNEILDHVNVATLAGAQGVTNYQHHGYNDETLKQLLENESANFARGGQLSTMLLLPGGQQIAYNSEWHDKYGPIQYEDGKLVTKPSGFFDLNFKTLAYKNIIDAVAFAVSDEFKKQITAKAEQFGIHFKRDHLPVVVAPQLQSINDSPRVLEIQKAEPEVDFKMAAHNIYNHLKQTADDYANQNVRGEEIKLTSNGAIVLSVLLTPSYIQNADYFAESLKFLFKLFNEQRIGARDFRRILIRILDTKPLNEPAFMKMLKITYDNVLPIEITFGGVREQEKYSELSGFAGANYKAILAQNNFEVSCKLLFVR